VWVAGVVFVLGHAVSGLLYWRHMELAALVVGLVSQMIALAIVGAIVGARNEKPDLGWGAHDVGVGAMVRAQFTSGPLGAWLGLLPFLVFVAVLIVLAHAGAH
jgi:hypothetical protein